MRLFDEMPRLEDDRLVLREFEPDDAPLLEASDVSYTFPYAPEIVQQKATKVVPTIVDALEDSMNDPQ